jgi:glutathione-regulated potassium-efflux system ancillary protein KefF
MICVIYAHPYPRRSHANLMLVRELKEMANVEVRSLYDLYPDFNIDVAAEQAALTRASLIVWMHPTFWYSVPGLLKHWFDQVLAHGWAYGVGGHALRGKHCLWVTTTGGDDAAYSETGMHEQPFGHFIPPIEETARFCGMHWESPYVVHGAHLLDESQLLERGRQLAARLQNWIPSPAPDPEPSTGMQEVAP